MRALYKVLGAIAVWHCTMRWRSIVQMEGCDGTDGVFRIMLDVILLSFGLAI
jgi:hypothetical protein